MDVRRSKSTSEMSLLSLTEQGKREKKGPEQETSKQPSVIVIEKVQRSNLEWILGLVTMLLLCICAVLAAELGLMLVRQRENKITALRQRDVRPEAQLISKACVTSSCLREASTLLENIDPEENPCDDLYRFACGGFVKRTRVPMNKHDAVYTEELAERAQDKLKALIEEPKHPTDPVTIRKAKDFYQSCVDLVQIEERSLDPLRQLIHKVGGWPVISPESTWSDNALSWTNLASRFRRANVSVNFFFEPRVTLDTEKGLKIVLGLSAASLGLTTVNDESRHEEYYDKLVNVAMLFGANRTTAITEMRLVYYFEIMAKHKYWENFNLNEMQVPIKISELQTLVPSVYWKQYISAFIPYQVEDNDTIVVDSPDFLPKFAALLENTDSRTLTNFAVARMIWNLAPLVDHRLRKIIGVTENVSRPRFCTNLVMNYFAIPMGSFYVKRYFEPTTKTVVEDLVNFVRKSYFETFDREPWDLKVKRLGRQKIADTRLFVAYPDELLNDTAIEALYKSLSVNKREFFENFRKITKYYRDKSIRLPKQSQASVSSWDQNGGAVIATDIFYFHLTNTVYLPAVMLHEVFRVGQRPPYLNFGALAAHVAKEMSKVLRSADVGSWRIEHFPTPKSQNSTTLCLRAQHAAQTFVSEDKVSNSSEVRWEDVDDIMTHYRGLAVARMAYKLWKERQQERYGNVKTHLAGLNYTADQLFWIGYAQTFCSKDRSDPPRSIFVNSRQNLNTLRTNMAAYNMIEFAEDFKCSPQSAMNIAEKCPSW